LYQKFNLRLTQLRVVGCCLKEGGFEISDNWELIERQCSEIFIYRSKDDLVCNFSEGEKYSSNLKKAKFLVFKDRGHFEMEKIPELIENINHSRFREI